MILYSKFNTERKSCFQLVTKIVKSKNYIYSTKSSCNPKSQIFLNSFFEKYKYLKNHNFSFIPLKPKKVSNSEISFSYQKYPSLEQLLFLSFQNNDKKTFISLIKKYLNTIKHNRLTNNILSPKFKNIFGDLHPKLTQNIFCIGCIDINFNNIFYDVKKKKYLLIDYEWTFIDVYIPYKYLFFRAISSFYANYFSYNLNIFIPLNTFYKLARITQNEQDMFIKFEYNLQHYVYGDKFLKNNKFDDFYQVYLQLKTLKKTSDRPKTHSNQ